MAMATETATEVLRKHGRSFYFASHLLSKVHRERASVLYAFCRRVDDIADESTDPDAALTQLEAIRASIQDGQAHDQACAPMLALMQQTDMPPDPVVALIDGVASDLKGPDIGTEADLLDYAYRVAGTVGVMMSIVLDVHDPRAWPFAIDLGIGMQLVNIARDVGQDARNGRIYLPRQWLGATEPQAIVAPSDKLAAKLQKATRQAVELANIYFASGTTGIAYLPKGAQGAILVAAKVYQEIGAVLAQAHYRSWDRRAVVSLPRKLTCAAAVLTQYTLANRAKQLPAAHDAGLHQSLQGYFGVDTNIAA